jgi:hypothetical protein
MDGTYDRECKPEVAAVIYRDDKGARSVVPARGFKNLPNRLPD